MKKILLGGIGVVLVLILVAIWQKDRVTPLVFMPRVSVPISESASSLVLGKDREVVAENLDIPWELVFLPDGSMLVTERPGRLLRIREDRQVIPVAGVEHTGEGGLLGMALHPNFKTNHFLYLYLTTRDNGVLRNRVERYTFENDTISNKKTIIENIPGSAVHDGGRIAFGPDKKLYVTTGDAGNEQSAQDTKSLAGKILRLNDDGSIPSDNPFGNAVYSYGHRNPQGIAWDSAGTLWATEHGRSGPRSGFDEVNLIEPGRNYGWPIIQGDEVREGMESPIAHSGASDTWAPSGVEIVKNTLFFAGLRGQALYKAQLSQDRIQSLTPLLAQQLGRLRTVVLGPDGKLYILTNNTDGRGTPKANDDKLIRLNLAAL